MTKQEIRDLSNDELEKAYRQLDYSANHIEMFSKRGYAQVCRFYEQLKQEWERRSLATIFRKEEEE